MRVVVTGATGNVGSRTVAALLASGRVEEVVGVARRLPRSGWPEAVRWVQCDLGAPDAAATMRDAVDGAAAVVHLAWQIQPSRDLDRQRRTNVVGSRVVFDAAVAAGVPAIVHASSVGAYGVGPKDRPVDESWPTTGVATLAYSRHKVAVERILDDVEARTDVRVVRLRPGLIFQAAAGSEIARYFLGPFVPLSVLQRRLLPVLPVFDRMVFQAVHTDDVAAAYTAAVLDERARGAFNIAAEPVLDGPRLAEALGARPVRVPFAALRGVADLAYRARLQPTDPAWLDLADAVPVMSTERARRELGWRADRSSVTALLDLLDGMRHGAGGRSPVLAAAQQPLGRLRTAARAVARGGAGTAEPVDRTPSGPDET
jgi:nucleoside-diphosphate-sugar epimerase